MESFVERFKNQIKLMKKFSNLEDKVKYSNKVSEPKPKVEISTIARHKPFLYENMHRFAAAYIP